MKVKPTLNSADMKLLEKKFATKEDLKRVEKGLEDLKLEVAILPTRSEFQDLKDEVTDLKIQVGHLPTKDEFYNKMDEVMGELKAIREEKAVSVDKVNDLEDRMDVVEEVLGIHQN
jgi:DNA repair exonuclease SbcCD ATPase subunit